jgi:hypothetical protein
MFPAGGGHQLRAARTGIGGVGVSGPTKAELIDELHKLQKAHQELTLTAAVAKKQATPPAPDPAVVALGRCIAGLDPLNTSGRSGWVLGSGRSSNNAEVRRILLYLADRYGVALVDAPVQPFGPVAS